MKFEVPLHSGRIFRIEFEPGVGMSAVGFGPVYVKKTTVGVTLLKEMERLGMRVMAFKHSMDAQRTPAAVIEVHKDKLELPRPTFHAFTYTEGVDILNTVQSAPIKPQFLVADEVQFAKNSMLTTEKELTKMGIIQLYLGLRTDWKGEKFETMEEMIQRIALTVELFAPCTYCPSDRATHSVRLNSASQERIQVGDGYAPACEPCHKIQLARPAQMQLSA